MIEKAITDRQQYWLDHIKAADRFDGTLVDYVKGEGLKVQDFYQWKPLLARLGVIAGVERRRHACRSIMTQQTLNQNLP